MLDGAVYRAVPGGVGAEVLGVGGSATALFGKHRGKHTKPCHKPDQSRQPWRSVSSRCSNKHRRYVRLWSAVDREGQHLRNSKYLGLEDPRVVSCAFAWLSEEVKVQRSHAILLLLLSVNYCHQCILGSRDSCWTVFNEDHTKHVSVCPLE